MFGPVTHLHPHIMAATDRCDRLASPNIGNFVVSCLILLGLLLSYFPQHYRIIKRRTTEGLSPWWILLGTTSGTCAVGNILLLPISRTDMACCSVNDWFSCVAGLLGIAQIGVQWGCFFFMYVEGSFGAGAGKDPVTILRKRTN